MIHDFTEGSIARQLILFSLPFMLASFLQSLYSTVDMVIVGQFCGEAGISAVSVGGQLIQFFTLFAIGFSDAAQVLIAQYVGAKEPESIQRTIGTAMTFSGILSAAMGIICIVFAVPLLHLLNTPEEAFSGAVFYMRICGIGMIFIYGYNLVSSFLRGMGDSRHPMIFIAISTITNIFLDLLFVGAFHMDAAGAALATVLAQSIAFGWAIAYLYRYREKLNFAFTAESFKIHGGTLGKLCRLGIPMALQAVAVTISFMIVSAFINSYGVTASALTGIGQKLIGLVNVVSNAVMTALSTMVGQNVAAGKQHRVSRMVHIGLLLTIVTTGTFALLCLIFPETVIGLFSSDASMLEMAGVYMPICVVSFIAGGIMNPYYGLISGIGYANLAMVIGLLDGVVARIGLSFLFAFGFHMGIFGFWWGDALAGYVTAILSAAYFYSGRWKTRKLITQD